MHAWSYIVRSLALDLLEASLGYLNCLYDAEYSMLNKIAAISEWQSYRLHYNKQVYIVSPWHTQHRKRSFTHAACHYFANICCVCNM